MVLGANGKYWPFPPIGATGPRCKCIKFKLVEVSLSGVRYKINYWNVTAKLFSEFQLGNTWKGLLYVSTCKLCSSMNRFFMSS